METWRRNLYILWSGNFFFAVGIGMIIPFLALYVQELGIRDVEDAAIWSAMIFGVNHLMIALFSPLWGKFADRYGPKLAVVCSGFGLAVVITMMGLVHSPLQLLLLRALFGTMGGYGSSVVALMAVETPKEHVGRVMGTLQTGNVTGQLLGPLFGGVMAEWLGMRNSFFFTGMFIMIAAVLALIGVRQSRTYPKFRLADLKRKKLAAKTKSEDRTHVDQAGVGGSRNNLGMKEVFRSSPVILVLFMSSFLIMGSNQSISPIISLYVKSMKIEEYVVLVSGLIFAFTALGAVIAAPLLGRLGDRRGHLPILLCALFVMGLLHIPQARVNDPWVLMGIRFLTGLCIGGLVPSVQALLRRMTPSGIQGSVFAYNQSANSLGNVTGAMTGGIVAGSFGIPTVFYMVAGVFFLHFILILATFRRINRASRKEWEASA